MPLFVSRPNPVAFTQLEIRSAERFSLASDNSHAFLSLLLPFFLVRYVFAGRDAGENSFVCSGVPEVRLRGLCAAARRIVKQDEETRSFVRSLRFRFVISGVVVNSVPRPQRTA